MTSNQYLDIRCKKNHGKNNYKINNCSKGEQNEWKIFFIKITTMGFITNQIVQTIIEKCAKI